MEKTVYDVFMGTPEKKPLWLGAAAGLERATEQMKRMAAKLPGDYFVFDPTTEKVVASVNATAAVHSTTET